MYSSLLNTIPEFLMASQTQDINFIIHEAFNITHMRVMTADTAAALKKKV
jgi:hypothetical protein